MFLNDILTFFYHFYTSKDLYFHLRTQQFDKGGLPRFPIFLIFVISGMFIKVKILFPLSL